MLKLLVSLFFIGLSSSQEISPGSCPEFTTKTDFEVEPYLGKWIEIQRFATEDQKGQTCNYADYSDNGDVTVGVHNAGLKPDGTFTEIFGYVEPSDVPGALLLHLDGVPVVGDYNVLDTDYDTYTSVYSCVSLFGLGHVEQAWILARNSTLSTEQLEVAHGAYTKFGVSIESFISTPQDSCAYP